MPEPLLQLISALGRLPGIGPRSAQRLALHLAQQPSEHVRQLAESLVTARERVQLCGVCGALTESQPCGICNRDDRDPSLICVVEHPVDVLRIENARAFRGRYHVLGGRLSPLDGVEPDDLRIHELETRIENHPIREIILALGTDVEGDATCTYLAQRLSPKGPRVTRLAHGLPAGSGLEFADDLTLNRAIEGRQEIH